MDDIWGPWIEHDGSGFPAQLVGVFMNVIGETHRGKIINETGCQKSRNLVGHWDWSNFGKSSGMGFAWGRVIRYRIRKPRGMVILESLLADLPSEVDA